MQYKDLKGCLLAIDLDGTLVENFADTDKETFSLLKEFAKNNKVIIATGRPFRSSKMFYDLLELNTPIINYNGAFVHHPRDSFFPELNLYLKKEDILQLFTDNMNAIDDIFCEREDEIYLLRMKEYIKPYLHMNNAEIKIGNLSEILPSKLHSSIVFVKEDCVRQIEDYLKRNLPHLALRKWIKDVTLVCELYNPLISKAKALALIANYYQIKKENIIAIGDGENDIEMLEFANLGIAVKGSCKELTDKAKIVVECGKEKSVKEFLLKNINE